MRMKCNPSEIKSKLYELKSHRFQYVYIKLKYNEKFDNLSNFDETVRHAIHLELLDHDLTQLEIDLVVSKINVESFYEFVDKLNIAIEYKAEITLDTYEDFKILDFISKKLNYYEEEHKNEQARTT